MKRLRALMFLTLMVSVCFWILSVSAADSSARTITVSKTEGGSVTMTKGAVKQFKAKEGQKLLDGYTVSTGTASKCYLNLDDSSAVVIDQNSKIEISQASSQKLSVSVLSGNISVSAAPQKSGESIEISAGNSTMAIRGTLFTFGYSDNRKINIHMIEGSGDVGGRLLSGGETMLIADGDYTKTPLTLDENSGSFLLETAVLHKSELLESGLYSLDNFNDIENVLDERIKEEAEKNKPAEITGGSSSSRASSSSSSRDDDDDGGQTVPQVPDEPPVEPPDPDEPPDEPTDPVEPPPPAVAAITLVENYDSAGGGNRITEYASYGGDYKLPNAASLGWKPDGKKFTGWNSAADGSGISYDKEDFIANVTEALTLYAMWEEETVVIEEPEEEEPVTPEPETVTLTLIENSDYGGGGEQVTIPVVYGESYTLDSINDLDFNGPEQTYFIEWNEQLDKHGNAYGDKAEIPDITEDMTLYAIWELTQPTYSVRYYDAAGNQEEIIESIPYDEVHTVYEYEELGFELPDGKTAFLGWAMEFVSDGGEYEILRSPGEQIEAGAYFHLDFYAVWE